MEPYKRKLWTMNIRRADKAMIERLYRAAELTGLPAVHLVRQAVREKLDRLAQQHPQIDAEPAQPATTTN